MHFRFLGAQDCPDWLLAQISECSKVSSVKFKGLCQIAVNFILNDRTSDQDLERFVSEHIGVPKTFDVRITKSRGECSTVIRDALQHHPRLTNTFVPPQSANCVRFAELSDVQRLLYSISFMMKNAASYNCDAKHFGTECTHLGLPSEHSKVIARVYTAHIDVLKQNVKDSIPKEMPIESAAVDEIGSTPSLRYVRDGETTICSLTPGQLSSLRQDMLLIQNIIETKFKQ